MRSFLILNSFSPFLVVKTFGISLGQLSIVKSGVWDDAFPYLKCLYITVVKCDLILYLQFPIG
jgi:hypothetical protein